MELLFGGNNAQILQICAVAVLTSFGLAKAYFSFTVSLLSAHISSKPATVCRISLKMTAHLTALISEFGVH